MIVQKDFLEKLKRHFSLNIYEVKIWTALLSRGVASAGELSDIGDVPRSRSYDVLESLEKKGFVIMKLGKPIKYIAVKPAEILERMKNNVAKDTEEKLTMVESIKGTDVFHELELLHKNGIDKVEATELSGALVGRSNVYSYLKSVIEGAQKSVTIVTTADGFERKVDALKNSIRRASRNGVKIKIMAPLSKKHDGAVSRIKEHAQIKQADFLGRFVIADGSTMVFMTAKDDKNLHSDYDSAVWVKTPFFISAFEKMFDNVWEGK